MIERTGEGHTERVGPLSDGAGLVGGREGEEEAQDDVDRVVLSEDFADLLAASLGERVQPQARMRLDFSRYVVVIILVGVSNDSEVRALQPQTTTERHFDLISDH